MADDVSDKNEEEEELPSGVGNNEEEEEEKPSSFRSCIESNEKVTLISEEGEDEDEGDGNGNDDNTTCTEDDDSSYDDDGENNEDSMEVLFKYNRLFGSLPRRATNVTRSSPEEGGEAGDEKAPPPLASECTATALGRLVLNPESTTTTTTTTTQQQQQQHDLSSRTGGGGEAASNDNNNTISAALSSPAGGGGGGSSSTSTSAAAASTTTPGRNTAISLPSPLPVPILALGFAASNDGASGDSSASGGVWIVDAMTAQAVATPEQLQSTTSTTSTTIVAVSWDASATQLAAIDSNGACTIWNDLKYAVLLKPPYSSSRRRRRPITGAAAANQSPGRRRTPQQQQGEEEENEQQTPQQQPQHNAFRGFMNILTGQKSSAPPPPPTTPSTPSAAAAQATTATSSASSGDIVESGGAPTTGPPSPTGDTTTTTITTTTTTTDVVPEEDQNDNGDDDDDDENDDGEPPGLVPTLTLASSPTSSSVPLQQQRVTYPSSFGRPTCMVIDPAYRRRREKGLIVGFENGRLVLTKRGMIFQRRTDSVLYTAEEGPIHTMTWRGSLLAWADPSGIRLMDVDQMVRIAHIDRPTGARPSLYPSRVVWPSLCFETSQQLLVAWGDCLLSLYVHEQQPRNKSSSSAASSSDGEAGNSSPGSQPPPPPPPPPSSTARRTVECNLAWQLDCVACGVAPLDSEHVAVLGQSLLDDDDDNDEEDAEEGYFLNNSKGCDMELQIISRINGQVLSADTLPLASVSQQQQEEKEEEQPSSRWQRGRGPKSTSLPQHQVANLMSSFAVPRMDNATETQIQQQEDELFDAGGAIGAMDPLQTMTTSLFASDGQRRSFCDSHLKWDLKLVIQTDIDKISKGESQDNLGAERIADDDANSIDSDDYDLLHHPVLQDSGDNDASPIDGYVAPPPSPPIMVVASSHDIVLARMRDTDDAISSALADNKAALALKCGLNHLRQLRRYDIHDLVNEYFRALLKLPSDGETVEEEEKGSLKDDGVDQDQEKSKESNRRHLSLRRMKLAAEAMPILLGGDISMWNMWIGELEHIPGALFIARPVLPVRDPILPKRVYARVLEKMLIEIEHMTSPSSDASSAPVAGLILEAEGHFLNSALGWGPTSVLSEFIRFYEQQANRDPRFSSAVHSLEESLARRKEQTSACYLKFRSSTQQPTNSAPSRTQMLSSAVRMDALFNVDEVLSTVSQRISVVAPGALTNTNATSPGQMNSRVALDAAAKLSMMKGSFDDALRFFLMIGAYHPTKSWNEMEDEAISIVNRDENSSILTLKKAQYNAAYAYVIPIIENHHLHQYLLNSEFLFKGKTVPPLYALLQLVGLDLLSDFLIEHCVAPQTKRSDEAPTRPDNKMHGERRGTLPLDLVARQLDGSPKLLHWYLHLVFNRKPSAYVVFPATSLPPSIITSIHRMHIDLYIRFAGENRDSALALEGIDAYRVSDKTTPLLAFLKVVLRLGGISSMEVGKILEKERKGGARTFALELAYIMEHYGDDSEGEARLILDLYLKGAQNLMLAVSYAQRAQEHSSKLWDILISHCLSSETGAVHNVIDGSLFGSLLEAAALSGADLAHLVKQIPPGMSIHGLRPRLVAAVADYRLKLQMRHTSSDIANAEKIALLREVAHRSRRGMRFEKLIEPRQLLPGDQQQSGGGTGNGGEETVPGFPALNVLRRSQCTIKRRDRCKLAYSLPLR